MRKVKSGLAALFLCVLVTAGGAAEVWAQGYRVRVYNPGVYSGTRRSMSNRAAARAALKRKKQRKQRWRAARARSNASRRGVN
ncbi:MAG: hypothetical protein ABW208_05435 [Pyrinomonadaceae bacterium]